MRIALPMDSWNYGKRLDYLARDPRLTHVDFISWPMRDFSSFGGDTNKFFKVCDEIGARLKGINHVVNVSAQLSYFLTAHPTEDLTKHRRSFSRSWPEIQATIQGLGKITRPGEKVPYLSIHHQLEMKLEPPNNPEIDPRWELDSLLSKKENYMKKVVGDITRILEECPREELDWKGGVKVSMENTSFNYRERNPRTGQWELTGRDEVAWLCAEDIAGLRSLGVNHTLDACHVMLQRMALDEYLRTGSDANVPTRLKLLIHEYGGVPISLSEMPNERGLYTLEPWVRIVAPRHIPMVHVNGCSGVGYEAHGLRPGIIEGKDKDLIDWGGIIKSLGWNSSSQGVLVPDVAGSHIDDPSKVRIDEGSGLNADLIHTLNFIKGLSGVG